MKKIVLLFFAFSLIACNDESSSKKKIKSSQSSNDENNEEEDEETKPIKKKKKQDEEESTIQVLNNIDIESKGGVKVYRTFLSYSDGSLVPSSNTTQLQQPIYLNINVEKGWEEEDGKVSIGASEKITTDNGTVLLEEADLFKNTTSLSADDAKFIRLKALINNMSGPINYFVVDFKVWDKNGDGVIKGSYKFSIE